MNTDRGLLFLIMALASLWLVFDEFYGNKRISSMAAAMTGGAGGNAGIPLIDEKQAEKSKEKAKDKVNKDEKLNKGEKDWFNKNIDHFFGDSPS